MSPNLDTATGCDRLDLFDFADDLELHRLIVHRCRPRGNRPLGNRFGLIFGVFLDRQTLRLTRDR